MFVDLADGTICSLRVRKVAVVGHATGTNLIATRLYGGTGGRRETWVVREIVEETLETNPEGAVPVL